MTIVDAPIIGREPELSTLDGLVTAVTEGRGGLAWIHGEPGIGKSALANAVAVRAAGADCTVFRGVADDLAQAFPLRLMADCLNIGRQSADPRRAQIARLILGETTESPAIDPVLAASERILELVDRWCADGPVVLIGEDLQWADEPSLLVWNRLARAVDQIPLLLVGTSRPVPQRATTARLREFTGERGGIALTLGPLDDDEVAQLAGRLAGAPVGPLLRSELARAAGNPLYLRELVNALLSDGLVEVSNGVAELRGDSGATPVSLAAAIGRRLRFQDPEAGTVLRMAALLGGEFDLDELSIVSGRPVTALSASIEEAIAAGVISANGQRLGFRHELIRQVLVEQTPAALRAGLRAHTARQLASAGARMDVVARHLLAVAQPTDGWVTQWLTEVPESMLFAAPQVAAELLARALPPAGADDPRWVALAARLVQVLFWLGRDEQVSQLAPDVARHSTDPVLTARMSVLAMRGAGRMGRPDDALALATTPVDPALPAVHRARMLAWFAANLATSGRTEQAAQTAGQALAQAREAADPLAIGSALHASSLVADSSTALAHIDEALAVLGEDPESMDLRMLLLNNRLTYLAMLGRWEEAERSLPSALMLAERTGSFRAAGLTATAAEISYIRGEWDDALVHLAGVGAEYLGNQSNLNAAALSALIALHRGERDQADAYLRAAGAQRPSALLNRKTPANWRMTAVWAMQAETAGDLPRALELMSTWLGPLSTASQETRQELMPHLVRLALEVGDRATAAAAAAAAQADAQAEPLPGRLIAARCCQAQWEDDADALLSVAQDYRVYGWPQQHAFALEEAAVRLAAAGNVVAARSAFNGALTTYFGLRATWDLRRTEARLRRYGVRRGPRTLQRRVATSGWDALTPSEQRVARLVAQGLSNPDIATELFLSRRTVQTHVSNVLVKLELRSRIEVVRQFANSA